MTKSLEVTMYIEELKSKIKLLENSRFPRDDEDQKGLAEEILKSAEKLKNIFVDEITENIDLTYAINKTELLEALKEATRQALEELKSNVLEEQEKETEKREIPVYTILGITRTKEELIVLGGGKVIVLKCGHLKKYLTASPQ